MKEEYGKITGRCLDCESMKIVWATGGWSFPGCYHKPYTGKRCSEIKDCPKEDVDGIRD